MATNYVQEGEILDLLAPYDRTSGQGFQVGSIFAVALGSALSGAAVRGATDGVWTLTKTSGQAWTVGQKIYWDNTNKRCDSDYIVGPLIGIATAVAANPSSTGNVRLNGTVPETADGTAPLDFSTLVPGSETNGSLLTTKSTWVAFPTADSCGLKALLSYTAATGEFATVRMRARSNSVAPVVCGNFSASAGQNDHGNLFAVQGYAQPNAYTQASASNIVCGLYACIDRTTGGTSIGRDWSLWVDTHMQVKASGGSYLARFSHNGTVANDGLFTVYNGGRMPVLFNFEDAAGFLTDAGSPGSTAAGYIAVKTPAGTKYISLFTA